NAIFHDTKPNHRDYKTLDQIYSKKNQSNAAAPAATDPSGVLALPQPAPNGHETVMTQCRPDGTTVVTYIAWAAAAP
ncbi:MAG TPA: hypothetical protein VFQ80_12815, partial [Thermomicrobiales bacterium]|nr:hypothetical protein [Thermomicrobiales bacterium]